MIDATWVVIDNKMYFVLKSPILTVGHAPPEGEVYVEEHYERDEINETLMLIRAVLYNPHFMNNHKLLQKLMDLEALLEKVKNDV